MKIIRCKKIKDVPHQFTGVVIFPSGTKHHYLNGQLHREDGPAVELTDENGLKGFWYRNGVRHRTDGPATEGVSVLYEGKEWFIDGKMMSASDHFEKLTPEEKEIAVWKINEWTDE